MKTINVNPSKVVTPVQIGYVTDHNETKLVFETQEETNNYLKLQISDHEYEPIPLTGKEWIVTSTYTDKARKYKAQLMRKIDGEYIANSPIFELVVNNSIYGNETIKEVVPPNFKTAYDNMVDITNQIKEAFENGDFNGNGIVSIEKTNTQENIDTYTITFNDETTSTFTVTNGIDGTTPNIQIGTVTTLESDQQVTVERTGDDDNPVFNFGIPKGEKGDKGDKGDTGLQGPPGIPGEATPEFKQMVEQSTLNATKAERFATQAKQSETNAKNSADGIKAESQKITENAEQITQIKEDLANKLSKSPTNWGPWTEEEQSVARARTGAYHVDFIGAVETEEEVASIIFDFEARSADRIITIIEMPPVSIIKPMNISIITNKGIAMIVQFGSGDQNTSQMRCFMSDTILLGPVAVSHNGSKSTNTAVLSGTESIFINDKIDKLSIRSVSINNAIPFPIGTKASLYMGA